MPDNGERLSEENERMLDTASCRDPPPNNYAIQMLERSLPSQQLPPPPPPPPQQQQSGGRKKRTGGIMPRDNYRGLPVELRIPKWVDSNKLWISSRDHQTAQYIGDAMRYFTGRAPFHFPDAKFTYLPLPLSTGEKLATREKCSEYVAKIAKDPALLSQRKDFTKRAKTHILNHVERPEVVLFLDDVRASLRQANQPRPETNTEDTDPPFTEGENGTAMEADTSSGEALATVDPSRCGSLIPAAKDIHCRPCREEHETPIEDDSLSVEAMTSYYVDFDKSTRLIASFELNLNKPGNHLTSAALSLGILRPLPVEKDEDVVPDNFKEFFASLDKHEEEAWNSTKPSDWNPYRPPSPFVHHSPLLAPLNAG